MIARVTLTTCNLPTTARTRRQSMVEVHRRGPRRRNYVLARTVAPFGCVEMAIRRPARQSLCQLLSRSDGRITRSARASRSQPPQLARVAYIQEVPRLASLVSRGASANSRKAWSKLRSRGKPQLKGSSHCVPCSPRISCKAAQRRVERPVVRSHRI